MRPDDVVAGHESRGRLDTMISGRTGCSCAAIVALAFAAGPALAGAWEGTVAPYIWVPGITVDSEFSGEPGLPDDGSNVSIIDKLDAAFMAHAEGRKGRWGVYVDAIYVELSDENSTTLGPGGPVAGDLVATSNLKLGLLDIGGLVRLTGGESGPLDFDVLLGARVIDIELDTIISLPGSASLDVGTKASDTDMMLGGRLLGRINERWYWTARADFSFGESEGTVNGLASVGYVFGETGLFSLDLGYRHMTLKTKSRRPNGAQVVHDLQVAGPVVGFVFRF